MLSMRRMFVALIAIAAAIAGCLQASAAEETSNSTPSPAAAQRALLNRYCVTCHNERLKTAGLMLDKMDVEHPSASAEVWEKVIRKLRTAGMPPVGAPRPDKAAYDSFATYLETALDSAAAAKPNPGRPAVHRLNRAEYTNAIRDLLALEIDGESLLPADDSGFGFDNIGDVLSVSPMLLDRYMSTARLISRFALGDPTIKMPTSTYDVPKLRVQDDRSSEDLPFGSRGGIAVKHHFPLDGEYVLKVRLRRGNGGGGTYIVGLGEPHELYVRLDDTRIKLYKIGGANKDNPDAVDRQPGPKPEDIEAGLDLRFPAKAGTRLLTVAFRDESVAPEGMLRPPVARFQISGFGPKADSTRDPAVERISIAGPFDAKGAGDTPSRHKIFVCKPTGSKDEELCAKKILSTLAHRAYRQPVTDADVEGLMGLYRSGRSDGDFETGIGRALQGLLVSREFLFRVERDPAPASGVAPDGVYPVNDLDLASRLSFFLWSSLPDDQLLDLAARGKLKDREVLEQQVKRMLRDQRSKALVDNFAGQWLLLRSLRSVAPSATAFPDFDENLREAFQREMELFFESMLREDRSVVDLLSANYTYVNERLARHYGIPNIYGSHFRRVILTDEARWGLLGKGSILTVTSYPDRTSPVVRGKFVLENILGTPPPPPPPNVPALQDNKESQPLTMRQRMEKHRANPSCAGCHARMDPIGFALDNFDAVGKWRAADSIQTWNAYYESSSANVPIDSSGTLPDGTKFQGVVELRKILMSHPEQFVTTVTEKLLTYALGRGVEYYDEPAVRQIMKEAARNDYRWSALVLALVKSTPFQMRIAAAPAATASLR